MSTFNGLVAEFPDIRGKSIVTVNGTRLVSWD